MLYGRRNKYHEINEKLDEIHSDLSQINKTISADEKKHPIYAKDISIISGAAGLFGILGNGINYLNDFQYCRYWSISTRFIKVSGSGDISRFLVLFFIAFILFVPCNWILGKINNKLHLIRSEKNKVNKRNLIIRIFCLIVLFYLLYAYSTSLIIAIYGVVNLTISLIFSIIMTIIIVLEVFVNTFDLCKLKKLKKKRKLATSKKNRNKMAREKETYSDQYTKWTKFTLSYMVVFLAIIFGFNIITTRIQTEFDIVDKGDKTYAVLYVSGDTKVMKECVVSGDNINIDLNNTYISNEPIKFETMNFIGKVIRSYYGNEENRFDGTSINDMM